MSRPNILFLNCHDLGQHLGCYGVSTVQSPNLDALAAEGIRLRNSFCVAPQCSPSRAAIFTGRYPHSNGVMGLSHGQFAWDLRPGERHLAQYLSEAGYHTALFGVQHERVRPEDTGYDVIDQLRSGRNARNVMERTVAHLQEIRDRRQPFYLQVGFFEPHRPFDHGGVEPDREKGVTVPPFVKDEASAREDFAGYQGAIREMDAAVGGILKALDRFDLSDETLVIFTTDHGMPFPLAKCSLYDPGLRTAFIARWPQHGWTVGRVFDPMIPNIDYLPTLLEALEIDVPARIQGRSFLPLLEGRMYQRHRDIFAEMTYHDYYDPMRCIRTETHKLIAFFSNSKGYMNPCQAARPLSAENDKWARGWPNCRHETIELYDLTQEDWEKTNLAPRESAGVLKRGLMTRLYEWMARTKDPLLDGVPVSPSHTRAIEALKAAFERRPKSDKT